MSAYVGVSVSVSVCLLTSEGSAARTHASELVPAALLGRGRRRAGSPQNFACADARARRNVEQSHATHLFCLLAVESETPGACRWVRDIFDALRPPLLCLHHDSP